MMKKLIEKDETINTNKIFNKPNAQKTKERSIMISRVISQAEEAIKKAREEGKNAEADELEKHINELSRWAGQDLPDEENDLSDGAGSKGDDQNEKQDATHKLDKQQNNKQGDALERGDDWPSDDLSPQQNSEGGGNGGRGGPQPQNNNSKGGNSGENEENSNSGGGNDGGQGEQNSQSQGQSTPGGLQGTQRPGSQRPGNSINGGNTTGNQNNNNKNGPQQHGQQGGKNRPQQNNGNNGQNNQNNSQKQKRKSVDEIIRMLKPLQGDNRADAKRALNDISATYKNNITEALKPIPNKLLGDVTNAEFNDIINSVLDKIDSIIELPFVDQDQREARIHQIQTDNSDRFANQELEREDNLNLQKDRQNIKARKRENEKYKNLGSIEDFKINFWRAIKDQVDRYEETEESPTRINRYYDTEDIIKKGDLVTDKDHEDEKPSIDFYFDMSGSWTGDKQAIEVGKQAVATVKKFEDRGEIVLNLYYFSDNLTTSMNDYNVIGQGTGAWNKIIANIKANKSKNVVLMTDGDMHSAAQKSTPCVVEGCVWIIWNDVSSEAIAKKLIGKQGTRQYSIQPSSEIAHYD